MTAPYAFPTTAQLEHRGEEPGFDVRAVLGFLRRRAQLIAAVILVVNVAVALVVLQVTPVYEATSLVIVDPRQNDIFDPNNPVSLLPPDIARVVSEVEILKSPAVLVEVIRKLNLTLDPEFGHRSSILDRARAMFGAGRPFAAEETLQQTLKRLTRAVSVDRRRATYVIAVEVRSEGAEKAARIANEIATTHMDLQISSKVEVASAIERALQGQLSEASKRLQSAETTIDTFIEQNIGQVGDPAMQGELENLRREIESNRADQDQLRRTAEQSRTLLSSGAWDELIAELDLQELQARKKERDEIEAALSDPAARTEQIVSLRERLAALERDMASEADRALTRLETEIGAKEESEQRLRERLRRTVSTSNLPRDLLVRLYEIQQETDVSRTLYGTLLSRAMSVNTQRDLQMPDSRIVSPALPPGEAASPKLKTVLGVSALGSLLLGLSIAFLRENYVGGLTDETQAAAVLGVPVVTSAPKIGSRGGELSGADVSAEVIHHPVSPYSEAIRRVKLGLDLGIHKTRAQPGGRVVLVTSALPEEGKTQTAISLARSLSLSGKSVLLVDGDLRRPSVHRAMGIAAASGMLKDPLTNLRLILLGARNTASADDAIFQRESFKSFVLKATGQFDYVVFDTSPLLPIVDARLLVPHAHAVVFVLRWAQTRQQDARTAVADLMRVTNGRVPIVTVLNLVEGHRAVYGYDYGGGHTPDADEFAA